MLKFSELGEHLLATNGHIQLKEIDKYLFKNTLSFFVFTN